MKSYAPMRVYRSLKLEIGNQGWITLHFAASLGYSNKVDQALRFLCRYKYSIDMVSYVGEEEGQLEPPDPSVKADCSVCAQSNL